ncbi:MAG: hypothetical protein U0931_05830 [Vulcanimicrobiota bacterium]
MIWILRLLLALLFTRAGQLHLTDTRAWEAIVPPPLPASACVLISGVVEIVAGLGLLVRPRLAALVLIALLVAVFPANIYQALSGARLYGFPDQPWKAWARLPLQPLLIWLVWLSR